MARPPIQAVPADDTFSRFCRSPNMSSLAHVLGFAGMVRPATEFILNAVANHSNHSNHDNHGNHGNRGTPINRPGVGHAHAAVGVDLEF